MAAEQPDAAGAPLAADPELSRQYDVEPWLVHDAAATMADYRARSEAALPAYGGRVDIAYGDAPRQILDICAPGGGPSPALVFIHGGYWRGSTKDDRRFPGPVMAEAGIAWAPVEYRLMPDVRIGDIVHDVRAAVSWLHRHGAGHGLDPDRIFVAGNSAGGHLSGMLLADGWQADYGVPPDVVKGACAVSGLFDLDPLRRTEANGFFGFTADEVAASSPIRHLPARAAPLIVSWGGHESDSFKWQSQTYAAAARDRGLAVDAFERPDEDHFTVIREFALPQSPLFRQVVDMVMSGAP